MEIMQCAYPVPHDIPAQDLFINKGELNSSGKLCEIRIFFDEGFGIQTDRII